MSRFYCENIERGLVELDRVESHHLMHVMRLAVGSHVELFDGKGGLARGIVAKITKKTASVEIAAVETFEPRVTCRVVIAAAVAKGQRFDLIISKCTELGADCIVPLIFERTVKQAAGNSVVDRYKNLSIVAAKQCGRIFLPDLVSPCRLDSGLEYINERFSQSIRIFGGFGTDAVSVGEVFDAKSDVVAFIGPEGGMTESE